ncbi:hypothetical protein U1Q18_030578 [Sarracenia purpurea var. burkii]
MACSDSRGFGDTWVEILRCLIRWSGWIRNRETQKESSVEEVLGGDSGFGFGIEKGFGTGFRNWKVISKGFSRRVHHRRDRGYRSLVIQW